MTYKSFDPAELAGPERHGLLLAAVAPRPIAFASTINEDGQVNLSPFSFFNVFSSSPPIMIFSPARRGRDNTTKHTYENVLRVPEVVINIVNHEIVEQMSLSSTEYPEGVNEFEKSGLTAVPSRKVRPPRVGESPVSFECRVNDVVQLGTNGGAGNLVMCEVVMIHVQSRFLSDDDKLDSADLDLVGRMGGSWYTRSSGDSLFEIPKPIRTMGIGVDALPEHIRMSPVLTGNNLGRIGNLASLPSPEAISEARRLQAVATILEDHALDASGVSAGLHGHAKDLIESGDPGQGLAVLLLEEAVPPKG